MIRVNSNKKKAYIVLAVAMIYLLMNLFMGQKLYAADAGTYITGKSSIDGSGQFICSAPASVKSLIGNTQPVAYSGSGSVEPMAPAGTTLVAIVGGNGYKCAVYTKSMDDLNVAITNVQSSSNVNESIKAIDNNLGVAADTTGASDLLSGVTPFISLAAGLIVIVITSLMTLFSALDCMFIAFPIFRNKYKGAAEGGNGLLGKKDSGSGETELRWISDDAQYAIEKATVESGQSKWKLYFSKRIVSYIFLAIIISILLSGNISIITQLAVRIVEGGMNILNKMAK